MILCKPLYGRLASFDASKKFGHKWEKMTSPPAPAVAAVSKSQKDSLANLPQKQKYAIYEEGYGITEDILTRGLDIYHRVSCRPITQTAEDDMEILSDIYGEEWGEKYLHHWLQGSYHCSRCKAELFSSADKWKGPCRWPSFRRPIAATGTDADAGTSTDTSPPAPSIPAAVAAVSIPAVPSSTVDQVEVYPYNKYTVTVKEIYCNSCDLFIGHGFHDGFDKGDTHSHATGWRY